MTTEAMSGNTVRCGNCTWTGKGFQAPCLCPECGEIAYLVEQNDGNATGDEQGYQDWPNYETWVVHLHIANAESLYRVARQTTDAEDLKSWAEYRLIRLPTTPDGIEFDLLSNDLLTHSLQKVDWSRVHSAITEE